jgi:hypothetical protein
VGEQPLLAAGLDGRPGSVHVIEVRCSMPHPCRPSSWALAVHASLLLAATVAAGGCTMCPDPLDYSGPVPNGSTPQNNFWARSNGILPLGASPRPWPPIVQSPTPASPLPEAVAADDGADEAGDVNASRSVLAAEPASEASAVR